MQRHHLRHGVLITLQKRTIISRLSRVDRKNLLHIKQANLGSGIFKRTYMVQHHFLGYLFKHLHFEYAKAW